MYENSRRGLTGLEGRDGERQERQIQTQFWAKMKSLDFYQVGYEIELKMIK